MHVAHRRSYRLLVVVPVSLFEMGEARKSAMKQQRSEDVLLSSPLQAPGLKAAKLGVDGNENADVSMGGGLPSLPETPAFPELGGSTQGGPRVASNYAKSPITRIASSCPIHVESFAQASSSPLAGGGLGVVGETVPVDGGTVEEDGDDDHSMKALMKMIKKMDGKVDSTPFQFTDFRTDF